MDVSLQVFEMTFLTLFMGVGLKLPPIINPKSGQIGRPCPDVSKTRPIDFVSKAWLGDKGTTSPK